MSMTFGSSRAQEKFGDDVLTKLLKKIDRMSIIDEKTRREIRRGLCKESSARLFIDSMHLLNLTDEDLLDRINAAVDAAKEKSVVPYEMLIFAGYIREAAGVKRIRRGKKEEA